MDSKDTAQKALNANPPKLGIYKHCKGGLYTLYSFSLNESTKEPLVHYYSHEKRTRWTWTVTNFFEILSDGVPRFTFMRPASLQELQLVVLGHLSTDEEEER